MRTVERVLALSPEVDLGRLVRDMFELHRALAGLIQLATLSDRVLAWPVFACNNSRGSWMLSKRWSRVHLAGPTMTGMPPLHLRQGLIPFVDGAVKPSYACFPSSLLNMACNSHKSLLPFEFKHWSNTTAAALPSPSNTVFVADGILMEGIRFHAVASTSNTSAIVVIDEKDATEGMTRLRDEPLVYVGHPLLVRGFEDSSAAFKSRTEECRMLHHQWYKHEPRMRLVVPEMPQQPCRLTRQHWFWRMRRFKGMWGGAITVKDVLTLIPVVKLSSLYAFFGHIFLCLDAFVF